MLKNVWVLAGCFVSSIAMEQDSREHKMHSASAKLVLEYLIRKEEHFKNNEDSLFPKELLHLGTSGVVSIPPPFLKQEVDTGAFCAHENKDKALLCADNKIFMVKPFESKIEKIIGVPKVEHADTLLPAINAVAFAKIVGFDHEQVVLGETQGRILIANPEEMGARLKTFGHIPGKVLGFASHPQGMQLAVRYISCTSEGNWIPCFALAAAFVRNEACTTTNSRRSWAPAAQWHWSDFVAQTCNHEVKKISFEEEACVTHCATGTIEKWILKNIEKDPELVKISESRS